MPHKNVYPFQNYFYFLCPIKPSPFLGTMSDSAIFSNNLKFQKSHLHQWKPINNAPVFLNVTLLMH